MLSMMFRIKDKNIKERIEVVICCVCLICLPFVVVGNNGIPLVYNDEYGYWANAAFFAGMDWSNIFSCTMYYSYGYSIILAVLLRIFGDTVRAYHAAVALNGVWMAGSYICLYLIVQKLYPDIPSGIRKAICFTAVLYCSNISNIGYTWPECFLFFVFCLITYLIIRLCESNSILYYGLLVFLLIYQVSIHQRTLAILIAAGLSMLYEKGICRKRYKELIASICLFWVLWSVYQYYKELSITAVWENGAAVVWNNLEGQVGKFKLLSSIDGWKQLILSVIGKLFYYGIATLGLGIVALSALIKRTIVEKDNRMSMAYAFILLSIMGTIAVTAIFMIVPLGPGHIVYGRYSDNIMGVVLVIAFCELYMGKEKIYIAAGLGFAVIAGFFVWLAHDYILGKGYATINSCGLSWGLKSGQVRVLLIIFAFLMILIITKLLCMAKDRCRYGIFFFCGIIWCLAGRYSDQGYRSKWSGLFQSAKEVVQQISELPYDDAVYVVKMDEGAKAKQHIGNAIQFLLPDEEMIYINSKQFEEIRKNDDAYVIIAPDNFDADNTDDRIFADKWHQLFTNIV